jgi:hypothetical protein
MNGPKIVCACCGKEIPLIGHPIMRDELCATCCQAGELYGVNIGKTLLNINLEYLKEIELLRTSLSEAVVVLEKVAEICKYVSFDACEEINKWLKTMGKTKLEDIKEDVEEIAKD